MEKIKLPMIELFYGHRCNLSCNGCSSFSDLIKDTSFDPTVENIFESIENLEKHVIVDTIDLMGGEIFLYWDSIELIIKKIRNHFPLATIGICTNGLLLDKYYEKVEKLSKDHGPININLTNHYSLFQDRVLFKKFHTSLEIFRNRNNLMSVKLFKSKFYQNNRDYFNENNKNLTVSESTSTEFYPCYYTTDDNKVKPFATNDPVGSRENGCAMPTCHLLIDSKLYKCSWFAFLPKLLKIRNQESDPDWEKYLGYKPVNLKNPTQEDLTNFYITSNKHIDLCDMCSNKKTSVIVHDKKNVLKK